MEFDKEIILCCSCYFAFRGYASKSSDRSERSKSRLGKVTFLLK